MTVGHAPFLLSLQELHFVHRISYTETKAINESTRAMQIENAEQMKNQQKTS